MTPIELLAHAWIWYALFGGIAVLFFLRTRRRRAARIAAMSSGWQAPAARVDTPGEPREADWRLPALPAGEGTQDGRRGHRCC